MTHADPVACHTCRSPWSLCVQFPLSHCCPTCNHHELAIEVERRVDAYLTTGDAADLYRVRGQLLPDPARLVPNALIPAWVRDWLYALAWDFEAHADRLLLADDQSLDYSEGYRAAADRLRNLITDHPTNAVSESVEL